VCPYRPTIFGIIVKKIHYEVSVTGFRTFDFVIKKAMTGVKMKSVIWR
jgi:hypothetical protein